MVNLHWIRDCWSFFVSILAPVVSAKDLYARFCEAGVVFDVFVPRSRQTG